MAIIILVIAHNTSYIDFELLLKKEIDFFRRFLEYNYILANVFGLYGKGS
jgi:hypothetical protein